MRSSKLPRGRGEVRREEHGRRLFVLRLVDCGKIGCSRCKDGPSHGPYWYEVASGRARNFWHYRGKSDNFCPRDFVAKAAKANEEAERRNGDWFNA